MIRDALIFIGWYLYYMALGTLAFGLIALLAETLTRLMR